MINNDFKVFATSGNANVISQDAYEALVARSTGFQSGVAKSEQLNKVWRQSSIMAGVLAQFIVTRTGQSATDDGTTATLLTNLLASSAAVNGDVTKMFSVAPATQSPHAVSLGQADGRYAPINSPQLTGAPVAPTPDVGDKSTRIATTEFVREEGDGRYARVNGDATKIFSVAPATESQHAMQLGQVQTLVTNLSVLTSSGTPSFPATAAKVKYRAIAGGGGGGSSNINKSGAGGAGMGAYSEGIINVAASGPLTVSIGAGGAQGTNGGPGASGGTTTITGKGVSINCPGGSAAVGVKTANMIGASGAGGSAPTVSGANVMASLNAMGAPGQIGACDGTGGSYFGGNGAPSPFGGPLGGNAGYPGAGTGAPGSGGSGGANNNFGGNGSPGVVIFEW